MAVRPSSLLLLSLCYRATANDALPATELVTPPLDGMILPGVTRDSVLALAREHIAGQKIPDLPDNLVGSERPIKMAEGQQAARGGTLAAPM